MVCQLLQTAKREKWKWKPQYPEGKKILELFSEYVDESENEKGNRWIILFFLLYFFFHSFLVLLPHSSVWKKMLFKGAQHFAWEFWRYENSNYSIENFPLVRCRNDKKQIQNALYLIQLRKINFLFFFGGFEAKPSTGSIVFDSERAISGYLYICVCFWLELKRSREKTVISCRLFVSGNFNTSSGAFYTWSFRSCFFHQSHFWFSLTVL